MKINERSLTVTLDSIGDGVISTDRNGNITRINRVAQHLTGWSLAEARGLHLCEVFRIVDAETGQLLTCPFAEALQSGITINLPPNTALVSRDGQIYLIDDSVAPIVDNDDSAPTGVVLVFRDITEKNRLEVELQQARKLEAIGLLAAGVAHNFNNLLAGIVGYSEMLLIDLPSDSPSHSDARAILESAQRAAALTSKLLTFSRSKKIGLAPVDMHSCIASAGALLEQFLDRQISIHSQLHATAATIMGDPALLQSIIINLGLNARDAVSAGGVIGIETENVRLNQDHIRSIGIEVEPGDYLQITISDQGTGMSKSVKNHLYEPFFTTKEMGKGVGLGLAVVYGTVKEHAGAMSFTSELNRGTRFQLFLPLARQDRGMVKRFQERERKLLNGAAEYNL